MKSWIVLVILSVKMVNGKISAGYEPDNLVLYLLAECRYRPCTFFTTRITNPSPPPHKF